jgi:hypothetical protein
MVSLQQKIEILTSAKTAYWLIDFGKELKSGQQTL